MDESKEFDKRYDKFKKNNMPTRFWDEERQTLEYVYFYNGKSILNMENFHDELEVNTSLANALGEIAYTGFYFPFTTKNVIRVRENGKVINKVKIGHDHAHTFDSVVESLYDAPETFSISKEDRQFYSKQELDFLRRVQKYLLFIGMKDLETTRIPASRYRNKIHARYENALIYKFSDFTLNKIMNGEGCFRVIKWYPEYYAPRVYKPREYQALIVDKEDNFKLFVEFTYEEIKTYKEIKNVYKNENLKDDDKLIISNFKILEIF